MDASEEVELVNGNLVCLDAELLVEFALSSALDTHDGSFEGGAGLGRNAQRVGAAGVCPHVGEGDFLGGSLLQKQAVLVVKEEDGESTVQETLFDVLHQVA
jgi:hypothetical protein